MIGEQVPDLPARIKALAEMTGPCPGDNVVPGVLAGITHALAHCARCDDTGCIALFKELRVPVAHAPCSNPETCNFLHLNSWVPESDVEKALHRIFWALPIEWKDRVLQCVDLGSDDERIFSAAEAWAQERQKGAQRGG